MHYNEMLCRRLGIPTKTWMRNRREEQEIDWSKVPVDTPILVKRSTKNKWKVRYFAKYEYGCVFAWNDSNTSWTTEDGGTKIWEHAKLAEEEKYGRY